MYRPLPEVLEHAHACGLRTTVTTNGMLLSKRMLASLRGKVDVLAISLDGVPASHNRVRASDVAFSKMAAKLEDVRATGIPFGFIFTLTQHNLGELDWVAGFALEQGARLLQIHPLEQVGRARQLLPGQSPDVIENGFAHLEALRIQEIAGERLLVQLDVIDSAALPAHRAHVFADEPLDDAEPTRLGDVLSPLVIEPDGTAVPLEYGFARAFALGNLHEARLRDLSESWLRDTLPEFRRVCRSVYERLTTEPDVPFSNWYELVAVEAEAAAAG